MQTAKSTADALLTKLSQYVYEGPFVGKIANGCAAACAEYPTLDAAEEACNAVSDCLAITFASKVVPPAAPAAGADATSSAKYGAYDGAKGYQLRALTGGALVDTTSAEGGEISWLRSKQQVQFLLPANTSLPQFDYNLP